MPFDLTTRIEGRPLVVLDEMPSFHNQVRACLWGRERVFQKVYENTDYWERETTVLDHLVSTDLYAVPQVRYRSRQQLMALLTAVPGVSLAKVGAGVCRQLAQSLRHIHHHQALVPRSQVAAMLRRFQENIAISEHLSDDEKCVSATAMRRLDHDGWIEGTMRHNDLVHGDINMANVLCDTENEHLGVLDFERASVGDGMLDLAKASWR
nr:aminoglycoside phosphotransferase family protein [Candidatus Gracilibacteria bacterium]